MTTQDANQAIQIIDNSELIERGLQAVEDAMFDIVNSEVEVLRDASRHILSAGGKRIRPRLAMLVYIANGGEDVTYAACPAAAVELMHTASVVHDDINDHGVLRRGRPSVNAIWGRTFALLTGDFLFTSVYQLMAPYHELNAILARAATALVEGETLQAQAVKNNTFTSEIYSRIIALKTAALFESATEMAARMAGARPEHVEAMRRYGYNVGLAFQIVDDILDIVGDETTLGKTTGIDLEQGRGFASVQDTNGKPASSALDVMDKIKAKLLEGDRVDEARQKARMLIEMALEDIAYLPESSAKTQLIEATKTVIERDH